MLQVPGDCYQFASQAAFRSESMVEIWYKVESCSKNTPDQMFFHNLINMVN